LLTGKDPKLKLIISLEYKSNGEIIKPVIGKRKDSFRVMEIIQGLCRWGSETLCL